MAERKKTNHQCLFFFFLSPFLGQKNITKPISAKFVLLPWVNPSEPPHFVLFFPASTYNSSPISKSPIKNSPFNNNFTRGVHQRPARSFFIFPLLHLQHSPSTTAPSSLLPKRNPSEPGHLFFLVPNCNYHSPIDRSHSPTTTIIPPTPLPNNNHSPNSITPQRESISKRGEPWPSSSVFLQIFSFFFLFFFFSFFVFFFFILFFLYLFSLFFSS